MNGLTMRTFSTKVTGKEFDEEAKIAVWKKLVNRRDYLDTLGYDICGKLIDYNDYRDIKSLHGWEIDHINPVSNGGGDNIENLQALFWRTNREKGDTVGWKCKKIF